MPRQVHAARHKTITIIDGSSGKSQDVVDSRQCDRRSAEAPLDQQLLETRGMAPSRRSGRTARARRVYAQPRNCRRAKDLPRIAIVVGGLGISASGTADAFAKLPAPVTFAFAPYGGDLEKTSRKVRSPEGHEVLLQVPMEPFDYPDNDPGPQTLLTALDSRSERRPAALADEPLPGLCRHRQSGWARASPHRRPRLRRYCARLPSAA